MSAFGLPGRGVNRKAGPLLISFRPNEMNGREYHRPVTVTDEVLLKKFA